jgi:hypothetical protein
VYKAFLGEV